MIQQTTRNQRKLTQMFPMYTGLSDQPNVKENKKGCVGGPTHTKKGIFNCLLKIYV